MKTSTQIKWGKAYRWEEGKWECTNTKWKLKSITKSTKAWEALKNHIQHKFINHTWFNSILDTCFLITDGTIWIWEFASIFGRYCHTLDTSNCFYILLSAFRQCLQLQWFQLFSGTQVWFWRQEFWFWTADGTLPSLFQQKHPKKCYQHAYLKWSITL